MISKSKNSLTTNLEYIYTYRNSIDLLCSQIDTKQSLLSIFYPLNFLIFQYLELLLKTIMWYTDFDYEMYNYKCLELQGHNIHKLLQDEYLLNIVSKTDNGIEDIEKIKEYHKYFSSFSIFKNKSSESMRFPFDIFSCDLIVDKDKIFDVNHLLFKENTSDMLKISYSLLLEHIKRVIDDANEFIELLDKSLIEKST